MGVATGMQPGYRRCHAVRPSDQDLTTLLFFQALERQRLIGQEAVEVSLCDGASQEYADIVFFEIRGIH